MQSIQDLFDRLESTSNVVEEPTTTTKDTKADIERRRKEELNSEKSFKGNRTQADLLRLPDNFLTKGEYVQINNVNISEKSNVDQIVSPPILLIEKLYSVNKSLNFKSISSNKSIKLIYESEYTLGPCSVNNPSTL
jgi:hypothetical protein